MNKTFITVFAFFLFGIILGQNHYEPAEKPQGHENLSKFKQLKEKLSTPNMYRTASGKPGPNYYQQQADYEMDIEIDDDNQILKGVETITYTNNSPEELEYLWVQLDQNIRDRNSQTPLSNTGYNSLNPTGDKSYPLIEGSSIVKDYLIDYDGGFKIEYIKDIKGNDLSHTINRTMMRINLSSPLKTGKSYSFKIKWWYNINNHVINRARSGYEYFEKDKNYLYVIAQFYPRMAVYNDVEGWQNFQFWGRGEFALLFGNFKVNITVPADHIVNATGRLTNLYKVLTNTQLIRWEKAQKTYDNPVMIVTEDEAREAEKLRSKKKKTWKFYAENVRDFGIASSRKFIWDAISVKIGNKKSVMAMSLYPKEGNPLWEEHSTRAVAQTLKTYSKHTFDYPYHKAISVHSKNQGMEYPMICWSRERPKENETYSDRIKYEMIHVIIHEIGHNFFPMIVNSDERQWTWMDEGLNTFLQYFAEQDYIKNYPSIQGYPEKIIPYMYGDQKNISPIMTQSESIYQFGNNAYKKTATALYILRNTIMGHELFDYAFKVYAQRWKFKHPTPEDFFRTMEDASAVDLDWFWNGWFYTTDYVDIGIKDVKQFYFSKKPSDELRKLIQSVGRRVSDFKEAYFILEGENSGFDLNNFPEIKQMISEKYSDRYKGWIKEPKYFYNITFEKPGGLVMPVIADIYFEDNSVERIKLPAQVWRFNDKEITKSFAFDKKIKSVVVDPDLETADVNKSNNVWGGR